MKNKKFRISDVFFNNRFVMVFSAVAAIIIWLVVAVEFSPEVTVIVKNVPVTIDYSNIKNNLGLEPFGETRFAVDVTVKGQKIVVDADDMAENLSVTANTSYVNSVGSYSLHLNCSGVRENQDFEIVSLSDDEIDVYFDYMKEKEFAVTPDIEYTDSIAPEDYYVGDYIYPESNVVKVSGPESEINKIKSVVASASLNEKITKNTTLDAVLSAETSDGSTLRFITFNKQNGLVHITIPVYKTAELPVSCSFINKPSDYVESVPFKITVSPEKAVFGVPENKLADMKSFELGSVDFSKLDIGSNVFTFSASDITGGIVADDTKEFKVTVEVTGMDKKTFSLPENIGFVNGNEGSSPEIGDLDFTSVTVVGPAAAVSALTEDMIILNADLRSAADSDAEEVNVPVIFTNDSCWLLGEYNARVILN